MLLFQSPTVAAGEDAGSKLRYPARSSRPQRTDTAIIDASTSLECSLTQNIMIVAAGPA